jgi:predicted DNA-binding transcriptional regulator YafY
MGGELLLVAHCKLRDAQRTFKVERIVSVTRMDSETSAASPSVSNPAFHDTLF